MGKLYSVINCFDKNKLECKTDLRLSKFNTELANSSFEEEIALTNI